MWKYNFVHNIMAAIIFTCLFACLLYSEPQIAFADSPLAELNLRILFQLPIFGFVVYLAACFCLAFLFGLLFLILGLSDEFMSLIGIFSAYIFIAVFIYCIAIAFGFIECPGGFPFD